MTNTNPPGGLIDLIHQHRAGRSYVELAGESRGDLQAAAIRNLMAKGLKQFPSVESIRGYSAALKLPVVDVLAAAAISLGLDPGRSGGARDALVIAEAGRLPEKSRALLREMAEQMLEWYDGGPVPDVDAESEPNWSDFDLAAEDKREPGHDARFAASLGDDGEGTQADPNEQS